MYIDRKNMINYINSEKKLFINNLFDIYVIFMK